MKDKFVFIYVDIWFNVTKSKFIEIKSKFKMLVTYSSIFVVNRRKTENHWLSKINITM